MGGRNEDDVTHSSRRKLLTAWRHGLRLQLFCSLATCDPSSSLSQHCWMPLYVSTR